MADDKDSTSRSKRESTELRIPQPDPQGIDRITKSIQEAEELARRQRQREEERKARD